MLNPEDVTSGLCPGSPRFHPLDGGLLAFVPESGLNVLIDTPDTRRLRRRAPRLLQVGLLTPCNLKCSFCYRDTKAPSLLTREFLAQLLGQCARWGVLEVAFGGGEPFLYRDFHGLLRTLRETTPLALNVTTNGMLLTEAMLEELPELVSELRLSAYEENDHRTLLPKIAKSCRVGINWLVKPDNVHEVVPRVREFLELGASNVLLLNYKGNDPAFQLTADHREQLRDALVQLDGLPIRLDICMYPHFPEARHMFGRTDCGAGDDFLVITPDRAVQACSFGDARIPFASFEELRTIWESLRASRPVAHTGGCTRSDFSRATLREGGDVSNYRLPIATSRPRMYAWNAWSSNNSGNFTMLAQFCSEEACQAALDTIERVYRAHLAFMDSDEGRAWVGENFENYGECTPPLREFGKQQGFEWPDDGFVWEEDDDTLRLVRLGSILLVYHPYAMSIGHQGLELFFAGAGVETLADPNDPIHIVAHADTPEAQAELLRLCEPDEPSEFDDPDDLDDLDDLDGQFMILERSGEKWVTIGSDPEAVRPDDFDYRVELRGPSLHRFFVFEPTMGGGDDCAQLLLRLAKIPGLRFALENARPPGSGSQSGE